jgi:hypothetical protein
MKISSVVDPYIEVVRQALGETPDLPILGEVLASVGWFGSPVDGTLSNLDLTALKSLSGYHDALGYRAQGKPMSGCRRAISIGGTQYFGKTLAHRLLDAGHQVTLAMRGHMADPFGNRAQRIQVDRRATADGDESEIDPVFRRVLSSLRQCADPASIGQFHDAQRPVLRYGSLILLVAHFIEPSN